MSDNDFDLRDIEISRRRFLAGGVGVAAGLPLAGIIAACSPSANPTSSPSAASAASATGATTSSAPAAAGAGGTITIAYPQVGGTTPFFSPIYKGGQDAAAALGVKINITNATPGQGIQKQVDLIDAAVATKPDGLMCGVYSDDIVGPAIDRAVKAGITVVILNDGAALWQKHGAITFVGEDEFVSGQEAGKHMKAAGVTKALILDHGPTNGGNIDRSNGFKQTFGGETEQVVVPVGQPTEVTNIVLAKIASRPDFNGIYSLSADNSGDAAIAALDQVNGWSKWKLGVFGLTNTNLDSMAKGNQLFAIDQQPYLQGYLPVVAITLKKRFELVPSSAFLSGPGFVTKENAAQVASLVKAGVR